MPVLPEGPIWFQHSSIARERYNPADPKDFYQYLLLEVVVNKPYYFKQGIPGNKYHPRTIEHTIGFEDASLPTFPNNQTNYRKWKYMSVMYGPEAKSITERIKLQSSVGKSDIVDRDNKMAPRIFLVPVRMPTALEQFIWVDLTYPLRAIYLPRQHKVDDGAYSDWCMFQHLSFRHRKLTFNSYKFVGEKKVTEEERANFSVPVDGENYKSGDEYLLRVIERLGAESGDKEAAAKSLSELKELQKKHDSGLRTALEKRLRELCDKDKYDRNESNKLWAEKVADVDQKIKSLQEDAKTGYKDLKNRMQKLGSAMHLNTSDLSNIESMAKRGIDKLEKQRKELVSIPHEKPLSSDEDNKLREKMARYEKTILKAREIDRDMQEAMRNRLIMNTYERKTIEFAQDYEYGWHIRPEYIARFDVSLIYNSNMLPRGWLCDEYQSPYCGVDIFSADSMNFPIDWGYKVKEMFSKTGCCDLADILSKEWGARLKYDDKPVEPNFVWGLVNSIAQTVLGLVPGWGPLLVYGDTLLYNLIFTDTFSKVAEGDKDSVAALTMSSVALLTGVGPNLKKIIKPNQDGSTQALLQMSMTTRI